MVVIGHIGKALGLGRAPARSVKPISFIHLDSFRFIQFQPINHIHSLSQFQSFNSRHPSNFIHSFKLVHSIGVLEVGNVGNSGVSCLLLNCIEEMTILRWFGPSSGPCRHMPAHGCPDVGNAGKVGNSGVCRHVGVLESEMSAIAVFIASW